jgi:hypothetical protein
MNGDNLNNVRRETKRHFRKKKANIRTKSKNKNTRVLYRDMTEFKKGYQPRTNLVKNETGDVLADP